MRDTPDILGRPWPEAKAMLEVAEVPYAEEITRPTKHFFSVDEERLFVVRVKNREEGGLAVVLAAHMVPKD